MPHCHAGWSTVLAQYLRASPHVQAKSAVPGDHHKEVGGVPEPPASHDTRY